MYFTLSQLSLVDFTYNIVHVYYQHILYNVLCIGTYKLRTASYFLFLIYRLVKADRA